MKLFINIKTLLGISSSNEFRKGKDMSKVDAIDNAYLVVEGNKIYDFGSMNDIPEINAETIDCSGSFILPGWCDSHTHLVFAASREDEFVKRIQGVSYAQIAEEGGGILNSANKMAALDEELLYEESAIRLEKVMKNGTTSIEIKSGYGLTKASELKMLKVIRMLKENFSIPIKSTFLGAHAIPSIYKENRKGYIDLLINEMIPKISDEGLADYIDVFCDKGFFTIEETDEILQAGAKYGLRAKIHANELAISGGVQVGIKNNAISVDHLEEIAQEEIDALLSSTTIPTVLPSCSYFLNIPYAPARKMINAGLGIAIASDYNPGTTPSGNIPLLISIACTQMKLHPYEAFNALTINGANAMELQEEVGSIAKGKLANFIITKKIPSFAYIPYAFGENHVKEVWVNGELI